MYNHKEAQTWRQPRAWREGWNPTAGSHQNRHPPEVSSHPYREGRTVSVAVPQLSECTPTPCPQGPI